MYRIWQKLLAELIGTFLFVFFSAGAFCADQAMRAAGQPGIGIFGVALARGLAFAVLVWALVEVSGAHLNPAITIGCWVTRKLGSIQAMFYALAQIAGAIGAAYALSQFVPENVWLATGIGTPDLTANFTRTQGILLELVLTFFIVFVFFGAVAEAKNESARWGGFAAGLAIFLATLAGANFVGIGTNPAMTLSTAIVSHHWANQGVYWAGPLLGGVLGGWIYHALFARASQEK